MALHMKGGTVEGLGMKQLEQLRYGVVPGQGLVCGEGWVKIDIMTGYRVDPSRSGAFPSVTDCAWLLASLVLMRQAGSERQAVVRQTLSRCRVCVARRQTATLMCMCASKKRAGVSARGSNTLCVVLLCGCSRDLKISKSVVMENKPAVGLRCFSSVFSLSKRVVQLHQSRRELLFHH